jgi:hypothetical protein
VVILTRTVQGQEKAIGMPQKLPEGKINRACFFQSFSIYGNGRNGDFRATKSCRSRRTEKSSARLGKMVPSEPFRTGKNDPSRAENNSACAPQPWTEAPGFANYHHAQNFGETRGR